MLIRSSPTDFSALNVLKKCGEKVENPWDEMEDTKSAPFIVLSPEDAPMDEKVLPVTESFKTVFQRFL